MLPSTKHYRDHLKELNAHYRGVIVALKPGDLCRKTIRFEIQSIERYRYATHNTERCTVHLKCLNSDSSPSFGFMLTYTEDTEYEMDFDLTKIDDLLLTGSLVTHSNVHTEEWFRPDMQCMAV